ncbi:Predicted hydrolase, HAD superfamily [Actinopolyspora xinjiangensis]|uniref:Predicted hydrolase, HAD superfamily n=1 Tax=Actinopolyspora xinjiangensis TaxID=405564 RepID=A0A1H0W7U1_9ACTN|nr:Predicted hydrolase, HAD superfamily [Actinopolyspora xinjiangensis]
MVSPVALDTLSSRNSRELDYVYRVIADGSCSVLSLDIFDTVLWRRVPQPTDLFNILGERLRDKGYSPSWITNTSFRRIRIEAEEKARRKKQAWGHEVSLFDIWREIPSEFFGESPLEDLVRVEVELEREFTVVDLNVAEVIESADKNGVPIVLVSDTYFAEDQLNYLLDRPELASLHKARIFRSYQHGRDKASGLWETVLEELGHSANQLVHLGDNEKADHEVPSELGIRTLHYRKIDKNFAQVLEREESLAQRYGSLAAGDDPENGDFGLTSLRAKALNMTPDTGSAASAYSWRFGVSVLGPVLTGFAEWVAKQAHEAGTPVVWCPMREGELLSTLVNNAARTRGWNVEAHPVWLSRQVTAIASLDPYDRDSVKDFIRKSYRVTVGQLLGMLNLRAGDVPSLAQELNRLIDSDEIVDRLSKALTETPHLINRLATNVTAMRDRLLRSLRSTGALDASELTLVDLGWGGTIQLQLAQVLRGSQINIRVSGLYLATDHRSTRLLREGLRAQGYLGQAGHPKEVVDSLRRSPEVLEQCTNALCGSLVGFEEDGSPLLGEVSDTESQNGERKAARDGMIAFQRHWNQYVANADGNWPELSDRAREQLATFVVGALLSPTDQEASVFGNWVHDDNFGSEVLTRIVPEDLHSAIPYLSPNDLDDLHMRDAFWPALIAASDKHLGAAVRARASGTISADMFEPAGEPFESRLRFLTGDDKWHDGSRQRVRINHNGLSFARLNFQAHDVRDVSLAIPGRPAIVRVDWIEAKITTEGDPTVRVLRWDQGEDFSGLTFAECEWLGGNMIQFNAPHSAVWLHLATKAGSPLTSAQISIAFAMLPESISGFGHRMTPAPRRVRLAGRAREEFRAHGVSGVAAGAARIAFRRLGGR